MQKLLETGSVKKTWDRYYFGFVSSRKETTYESRLPKGYVTFFIVETGGAKFFTLKKGGSDFLTM